MPTIKLTDKLGLDITTETAPRSALTKYFQQLPALRFDDLDLSKIGGLTLDQPAIQSLNSGVSFQDPVSLGDGAPALTVGAGVHASIAVITDGDGLPATGENPESRAGTRYFSFGIDAVASVGLSTTVAGWQFGAAPSTELDLVSYSRFPLKSGITLVQALQQTVSEFSIPVHSGDLADLAAGQIVKLGVSGKLQFSGSVNLLATTNPLASVSLPAPMPALAVSAGGSATLGVTCTLEGAYEVLAEKLDSGAVRLGWSHKNADDVAFSATVSESISAAFGATDLFSTAIGLISASPEADLQELASAKMPDGQARAIQGAVKAAISRKLELAIRGEISAGESQTVSFLYEIVPALLTDQCRNAIDQALHGDLTALHGPALPGVSQLHSIWDNARKNGLKLDVNLLGILNYSSVASLCLSGKVLFEPATGSLVISDEATAQRIQTTQVNFGADTQKLRQVLAESFLLTAAYRGAKQIVGSPSLRCTHSFFDLKNATGRGDMAHMLQTGSALGLLDGPDAQLPAGTVDFGRTLIFASTDYGDDLVKGMFLDGSGAALAREAYETAGREAIQLIVLPDDDDAIRRQPATDDALWASMKDAGQPGFAALFPGVPEPFVGAITADYTVIQWWADTMRGTAEELVKVLQWMARHPAADSNDPEFSKLRQNLAGHLRQVAGETREEFGQPWGLIAMDQLTGNKAGRKILITGPALVRDKSQAPAA